MEEKWYWNDSGGYTSTVHQPQKDQLTGEAIRYMRSFRDSHFKLDWQEDEIRSYKKENEN